MASLFPILLALFPLSRQSRHFLGVFLLWMVVITQTYAGAAPDVSSMHEEKPENQYSLSFPLVPYSVFSWFPVLCIWYICIWCVCAEVYGRCREGRWEQQVSVAVRQKSAKLFHLPRVWNTPKWSYSR